MTKKKTKKRSKQESLELTKTLVLNFNEVEKVAKYEKKTSKKPAMIIAMIGIFAIFSGIFYSNVDSLNNKKVSKFRKTTKIINKLICTKSSTNSDEQTISNENITLNFKKNKLNNYTKAYSIKSTTNHIDKTPKSIEELDKLINEVNKNNISGYKLTINKKDNKKIISEYNLKLLVNLKEFDNSSLTDKHKKKELLNVIYNYKDNALKVREDLIKSGYTCN